MLQRMPRAIPHTLSRLVPLGTWSGSLTYVYLQVILEPSDYSQEKFALYQSYEKHIHNKPEKEDITFLRFLVQSPLEASMSHFSK